MRDGGGGWARILDRLLSCRLCHVFRGEGLTRELYGVLRARAYDDAHLCPPSPASQGGVVPGTENGTEYYGVGIVYAPSQRNYARIISHRYNMPALTDREELSCAIRAFSSFLTTTIRSTP